MARNKKDHRRPHRRATRFLRSTLRRSMCIAVSSAAISLLVVLVLFVSPSYNEDTKLATTTLKQPQQQNSHTTTTTTTMMSHDPEQQSKLVSVQNAGPEQNNNDEDEATTETAVSTPAAAPTEEEEETTPWQRLIDNAERHFFKAQVHRQGDFTSPEARAACARFVPSWILQLRPALEEKIYSQYGEDGITRFILQNVAPASLAITTATAAAVAQDNDKFYVEFGVESGVECNTRFLRELYNWTGLLMDGGYVNASIGLQHEMIHPNNIVDLFQKYNVPKAFGLLSEDTDYSDYYIWQSILQAGYRPRVLISEYNSNFNGGSVGGNSEQMTMTAEDLESESVTVHAPRPGQVRRWDGTDYYGVSALALKRLWNKYGYIMIYCTKGQVNCFGIHESDALLPALLLREKSSNKNNVTSLSATATAAQECLWNKPLTWPLKMHPCNTKFESWSYVDKDGNLVADSNIFPLVVQHCRKHLDHRHDVSIKVNGTVVG